MQTSRPASAQVLPLRACVVREPARPCRGAPQLSAASGLIWRASQPYPFRRQNPWPNASPSKRRRVLIQALQTDVAEQAFQPQLDPLPAAAFAFVFAAFFVVQSTIQRALAAREQRERTEAELKQAKLQQLGGAASIEEVKGMEAKLRKAYDEEQAAAEVLSVGGLKLRVMVPRPIGTPLEDLYDGEDGARTGDTQPGEPRESQPAPRAPPTKPPSRPGLLEELSRDSRASLVLALTVLCLWSLLGLSSDPTAPAPEWLQEMGQNSK